MAASRTHQKLTGQQWANVFKKYLKKSLINEALFEAPNCLKFIALLYIVSAVRSNSIGIDGGQCGEFGWGKAGSGGGRSASRC